MSAQSLVILHQNSHRKQSTAAFVFTDVVNAWNANFRRNVLRWNKPVLLRITLRVKCSRVLIWLMFSIVDVSR